MPRLLLLMSLCAIPFIAYAQTPEEQCNFEMKCVLDSQSFSLLFQSRTGTCEEDDMDVFYEMGHSKKKLALKPALYSPIENIGNGTGTCFMKSPLYKDPVQASVFTVGNQHVLAFYKANARPGYDHVHATLLDAKTGNVLDNIDIGESKDNDIAIMKTASGFKLRIVKESVQDIKCDCSAAFVDEWMEIQVNHTKIMRKWLK